MVKALYFNDSSNSYDGLIKTASITGNASLGVPSIAILLAVVLVFLLLQKDPTTESARG